MPTAARTRPAPRRPRSPARAAAGPARSGIPRGGAGAAEGPAIKLGNKKAEQDPRFKTVINKLKSSADKTQQHPPAAKKASEAQAAALPPKNEKLAGAQANQVDALKGAETKKPESGSFLAMLRAEIKKAIPAKTEDAKDFMQGQDKEKLKGAMTGNISQQKEEATAGIKSTSEQPPDPSTVQGKEVTPLPSEGAAPPPPQVGAADAMPAPAPDSDVSLEQGKKDADKALADAEVTTPQLEKANDPKFTAVVKAKGEVQTFDDKGPQQYRVQEQMAISQAAAKAVNNEKQDLAAMQGEKNKSALAVKTHQLSAKEKDEQRRKEVTDTIEKIFQETKQSVDSKLENLETEVTSMFDRRSEQAIQNMKDYVETRFDDRYSGISGKALWLKDKLLPLPDAVKAWFDLANKQFLADLDTLVVDVANLVEKRLKEAKDEITKGQQRIRTYVEALPKDLQEVGKAAQKEVSGRFDELRKGVDEKKNNLAQKLAQRNNEAQEKGAAALKELKDAHKSLFEKLMDKLREIIEILRKFKERVVAMLKKVADTIKLIVADPIGFLKNLLSAVKQGFSQFIDNILTHLKAGFMGWLFGSLAETGIEIPTDFSLASLLFLVLQILGLTYDRMRAKAVKIIGERNVALLEKVFALIKALITGGPAAMWEQMKEYLSDLKDVVIGAIQDWLIAQIIKTATIKLISLFNPVGAIIQAILMIYNTVMFFVERINQILELVESIINSVDKIVRGDIAAAANWVEKSLARTIPVIIAFLARLLGISGITQKIKEIIKKLQNRVDKAVDKVIEKIMAGIKKLVGVGKAAVASVLEWWKKKKEVKVGGKTAVAYFEGTEQNAKFMIKASPSQGYTDYLAGIASKMSSDDQKKAHADATKVGKKIEGVISSHNLTKAETDTLVTDLNRFGELMEIMMGAATPPPSIISYGAVTAEQGGASAEAKILSNDGGGSTGSEPADDPPIWQAVQNRKSDDNKRAYVQGHMLNHNVHGPGKRFNMSPITYSANSDHKNGIEKEIKERVLDNKEVVYYKVTAVYGTHPTSPDYSNLAGKTAATLTIDEKIQLRAMEADRKLPLRFEFVAHTLKSDNGKWVPDKTISHPPVKNEIPKKAPGPGGAVHVERLERLSINNPTGGSHTAKEALLQLESIGEARAAALLAALANGKFTSWDDLAARKIPGVNDDLIKKWKVQVIPGTSQRLVYFHGDTIWK